MIDVKQAKRKKEIFEGKRAVASACAEGEVTSQSDTIFWSHSKVFLNRGTGFRDKSRLAGIPDNAVCPASSAIKVSGGICLALLHGPATLHKVFQAVLPSLL